MTLNSQFSSEGTQMKDPGADGGKISQLHPHCLLHQIGCSEVEKVIIFAEIKIRASVDQSRWGQGFGCLVIL